MSIEIVIFVNHSKIGLSTNRTYVFGEFSKEITSKLIEIHWYKCTSKTIGNYVISTLSMLVIMYILSITKFNESNCNNDALVDVLYQSK